jgi:hypothetical protein
MASKKGQSEWLRKIAARDVMGAQIKDLFKGETLPLFAVYGYATGTKTKDTQYGVTTAVTGMFEAVRLSDGAIFQSTVAYIPEPAGSSVAEAVKSRQSEDSRVEFSIEVSVKASKKSALGYEYVCKPFQNPEEREQLSAMRAQVAGLLAAQ